MRPCGHWILILLFSVASLRAQVTEVPSSKTESSPKIRPILIGQGPEALINRIDTDGLIKKGQQDGWVRFICAVRKTGEVLWSEIFGSSSNSDALKAELAKRLSAAADPRFLPAIYDHHPVDAIYYGTLTFAVVKGKPRLRIFSNQEVEEVAAEHDFIAPQPFMGAPSKFTGFHYPNESARVAVDGVAQVKVKVDENGNLLSGVVTLEEPPYVGFADAAVEDLNGAKFIPAFRDGVPVACEVTLPMLYKARSF